MKFELKTEKENYLNSFSQILSTVFKIAILIILCDVAIKLGFISRHYQIKSNCEILSVDKSKTNFRKLSRLTTLKSRQKIWEFCKELVK